MIYSHPGLFPVGQALSTGACNAIQQEDEHRPRGWCEEIWLTPAQAKEIIEPGDQV
jgi:hypothetical protein